MSLGYYMDENIESAVTDGLRQLGIDVLTAQQDNHRQTDDTIVFDRAVALGRVMVSTDTDVLREATARLYAGQSFPGLVFWPQQTIPIGTILSDLHILVGAGDAADVEDRITFLPL